MHMSMVGADLDLDAVLLCQLPGMRASLLLSMLTRWGSATEILRAPSAELRAAGMAPALVARIVAAPRQQAATEASLRSLERMGITPLPLLAPGYPQSLRDSADPPLLLYYQGRRPLPAPLVAFVGGDARDDRSRDAASKLIRTLQELGVAVAMSGDETLCFPPGCVVVVEYGLLLARSRAHEELWQQVSGGISTLLSVAPVNATPNPVLEQLARRTLLDLVDGVVLEGAMVEAPSFRSEIHRWTMQVGVTGKGSRSSGMIDGGEAGALAIARALGIRTLGSQTVQQERIW